MMVLVILVTGTWISCNHLFVRQRDKSKGRILLYMGMNSIWTGSMGLPALNLPDLLPRRAPAMHPQRLQKMRLAPGC